MYESCMVFWMDCASLRTLTTAEPSVVSSGGGDCEGNRTIIRLSPRLTKA